MKNGRDRGFNYWKLNFRKKFIRTLWMIPVDIFLIIQLLISDASTQITLILIIALVLTQIAQSVYTYMKWKSETQNEGG